jgi:S1-C subfamily serine protease
MDDVCNKQFGMPINYIFSGSPVEKAGAKVGDRIISVDGVPIPDAAAFIVSAQKRGETYEMEVLRGGRIVHLHVDISVPYADPKNQADYMSLIEELSPPTPINGESN